MKQAPFKACKKKENKAQKGQGDIYGILAEYHRIYHYGQANINSRLYQALFPERYESAVQALVKAGGS